MAWRLVEYVPITGTLTCRSGLRIGGSKDDIGVGEMDNPIIRDPLTKRPYLPGSSLKGKLRSLSEYRLGLVPPDGQPHGCSAPGCILCRVFGAHKETRHPHGPTRLIVRDAGLTEEWRERLDGARRDGINYAEVKTENWVNRNTGVAGQGGLRTQERVPAGTQFGLTLSLRVFEGDDKAEILGVIHGALAMLREDTLGSSGTRGYGWVDVDYQIGEGKPC